MSRRALILVEGASNTLRYVEAAQRLGLHPIILSADPTRYDYLAAGSNDVVRVDTDNIDALIRECSRTRAAYDSIGITSATEVFYATSAKLCRHFDLPGPNPTSIERCRDKFTQRQLLAEAGVPIPACRLALDAADIESYASEIGFPVVLKPAVGSASIGVRLCRNVDELSEHTNYLLGEKHIWSSSPRVLVEEFAQGPYYSTEIMGSEIVAVCTAEFGLPPHFICHGFTYPAPLTNGEYERIADVSLSCLAAVGLGWGPTNVELRWTKRGPVVIEVNPRLSGRPGPELVRLAYGMDPITEHIKLAVGDEWDLRRRHSHIALAQLLVADRDGTLHWMDNDGQVDAVSGVAEVKFYVEPNTRIARKGDCSDWIGHVIAASPTLAETEAILQRALDSVNWSITPFPDLEQEQSAATDLN